MAVATTPIEGSKGGCRERLWSLLEFLSDIRYHYYRGGSLIGTYPRTSLFCAMLLSFTSYGMQYIELRDSIREGYTALQARSRYETQALREFMNTSVDPMEMIVLLMAKDGGSVHRKAHLDEAATIVDFIYNMTVTHENRSLVYKKMCSPYCFANELFGTFKHYYDVNYRSATKSGTWSDLFNLSYPFASIWGYRVPLEQCLFGVVLTKPSKTSSSADTKKVKRFIFDEEIPVDRSKPLESQITNMEYVRLVVLFPYGFKNTTELQTGFALWELGIHEWTKKYNKGLIKKDSKIEVLAYGNEILDMEVNEDNRKMAPFFGIGFASMLAMVVICVLSISYYYQALDVGKILIGVCATLCPLLGITSTYGLLALFGVRVNSLLLVMPFLIMGVGVDALFLMMYSWQKMMEYNYTPSGRLGMVFEECGPSITITSVTNVLAFGIGAITPTPEVRLFCVGSSIAIFLTYVYQLILFGPALAIATTYERPYRFGDENKGTGCRALINVVFLTLLRTHCAILSRAEVAVVVFIMTVIYLCLGIQGLMTMNVRLDSEKILPRDSELHRPNTLLMNYVWEEHLSPIFLVNNRFNLTNTNLTDQFWDVLKELETLPLCKGPASSHVWLRDFADSLNKSGGLYPYDTKLNPARVKSFLKKDRRHFDMTIRFSNDSDDETVERFLFMVAYTNVTNWDVRIELMTQWRNVIAKYHDLNMTVYESAGFYVDQMLSLTTVTVQSALFTLASMTVVCAIFMGNFCSTVTAAASMASISIGVIGFMSLFHFDLDPVVMVSLLMSIGMSVDYIAHVAYHLQLDTKSKISHGSVVRTPISGMVKKVENTVECVALPLAQSGLSTITCVLPLLFLPTYSSSVFVTAIVLVVTFGTLHSLIILPVFLIRLPEWVTSGRFLRGCACRGV